jgi:hypothetical protein
MHVPYILNARLIISRLLKSQFHRSLCQIGQFPEKELPVLLQIICQL